MDLHNDEESLTRELIPLQNTQISITRPSITHVIGIPLLNFIYQLVKNQSPERLQNIKLVLGTLCVYFITLLTYYLQVCISYDFLNQ